MFLELWMYNVDGFTHGLAISLSHLFGLRVLEFIIATMLTTSLSKAVNAGLFAVAISLSNDLSNFKLAFSDLCSYL